MLLSNVPSIKELNDTPIPEVCLHILRALHTSDLCFLYMLFKKETLEDLSNVLKDLNKMDDEPNEEVNRLCDEMLE